MSLPINIKDLIHGHSVEWERLKFIETDEESTYFMHISGRNLLKLIKNDTHELKQFSQTGFA